MDDVAALLALAVLSEIPLFLGAMAGTWVVHEWVLHGRRRRTWDALRSRRFWRHTVWDHPGYLLPSYVLLFLAFLSLLQLLVITMPSGLAAGVFGLVFPLAFSLLLGVLGFAALQARLRSHMA